MSTMNSPELEIVKDGNPWFSFFTILGLCFLGVVVFQGLGVLLLSFYYDAKATAIMDILSNPLEHPDARMSMIFLQGVTSIGGFILTPVFYLRVIEKKRWDSISVTSEISFQNVIIVFLIVVLFMFVNGAIIKWNQELDFPDFMQGFETWAKGMEADMKKLTEYFTDFGSFWEFLFAFLIIAVVPGIGEELIFRGLLQNKILAGTKNIHIAIWLSAIIFSAIHIQFYGFVPRMLLGALFGYMYAWSGNLLVPMIAHAINNGFTIIAIYVYKLRMVKYDIEQAEDLPLPITLVSAGLTIALLVFFRKQFKKDAVS